MSRANELLDAALRRLPARPEGDAARTSKKGYSEELSRKVAEAFGAELQARGLSGARPSAPGDAKLSGAERRIAGGIGAKKVDVTWATEDSGLLLGISVKSINFADARTGNYQKNLTNRRGDMLFEAVTLHRRFPFAVLVGMFFFDEGAAGDGTSKRRSTFENAHRQFRLFTDRPDPEGREEQFERFYIALHNANPTSPSFRFFRVGDSSRAIALDAIFDDVIDLLVARNPDFYESIDGVLRAI